MKAKSRIYFRGFMSALAKRLVFVFLVLVVLQLVTLQLTVDNSDNRATEAGNERLQKALRENQKEHEKTQRYLRCIVLLPVDERTEENFAKCGETGKVEPSINRDSPSTYYPPTTTTQTATTSKKNEPTSSAPPDRPAPAQPAPAQPETPEPQPNRLLDLPVLGDVVGGLGL